MTLKVGTIYRVYMPDGRSTFSTFRFTELPTKVVAGAKLNQQGGILPKSEPGNQDL